MAARLLLAEDTRDLNRAVVAILEHAGYEVVPAYDGAEALHLIEHEGFDGIVLDIMMPKMSGLEVLSTMRAEGVHTPVLLLTAKAEVDDRVAGLEAGADDYLPKPFSMKELVARVHSMTRRHADYDRDDLGFEDLTLRAGTFELRADNAVRLSVKEFELMQALMRNVGHDHGLGTEFLLGGVWADEPDVDADTVTLYVSYLRSKLKWIGSHVTIDAADGEYRLSASVGEGRQ